MSIQSLKDFIASATPLDVPLCLKRNGGLGLFAGGVPVLVLLIPMRGSPPFPMWGAALQIALGFAFALASAVAWRRRDLSRRVLFAQGIALTIGIAFYFSCMLWILSDARVAHVAHPPGLLALGGAYALRLIVDFLGVEESRRVRLARRLAIVGLVVGGCGDAVLITMMFHMFRPAG